MSRPRSAKLRWTKFFWQDWDNDKALNLCEPAAQALWMKMLVIAAAHDPVGYVAINGQALTAEDLKHLTGWHQYPIQNWLNQLQKNGVFSRDEDGTIFSRRMVRDAQMSEEQRKRGLKGGNPNLTKTNEKKGRLSGRLSGRLTQKVQGEVKPPLKPEADIIDSVGREKTLSLFPSVECRRDATPLEGYAPRNSNQPRANPEHPAKLKAANGNGKHLGHALWPTTREKISTFDDEDIPL